MEKNSPIYLNKLADKMGKKEAKVSMIIETFVIGLSADLHAKSTIGFEPFGAFSLQKHMEYVSEEEGKRVLYPPRLQVEFSSSAIAGVLLSDDDADLVHTFKELAEKYDASTDAITLFISRLKSTLKSVLLQEKYAYVPYLGSFEGELGSELQFTADAYFCKLINKPFSYFEPVVINEEDSATNREEQQVEGKADNSENRLGDGLNTEEVLEEPIKKEVNQKENLVESVEKEVETSEEEGSCIKENCEEPLNDLDATDGTNIDSEGVDIEVSLPEIEVVPTVKSDDSKEQDSEEKAEHNNEGTTNLVVVGEESVPKTPETNKSKDFQLFAIEQLIKDKDKQIRYYRRVSICLIVLLFLLIISIFLAWSSGYLKNFNTNNTQEARMPIIEQNIATDNKVTEPLEVQGVEFQTPTDDAVSKNLTDSVLIAPVAPENREEGEAIESDELNYVYHKLKRGETLRGISYKYYKNKDDWQILVDANQEVIQDPDRIPVGEIIRIPKKH